MASCHRNQKSNHLFLLYFFTLQKDEVYLNLVLEYIPETVYKTARQYAKSKQTIPINFIRVSVRYVRLGLVFFSCVGGQGVVGGLVGEPTSHSYIRAINNTK